MTLQQIFQSKDFLQYRSTPLTEADKRYELAFPSDLGSEVYLVEVRQGEKKEVRRVLKR